jgi:hypothetical protein
MIVPGSTFGGVLELDTVYCPETASAPLRAIRSIS